MSASSVSCPLKQVRPARWSIRTGRSYRGDSKEEWMTSMYSLRPTSHVSKYFCAFWRVTNACRSRNIFKEEYFSFLSSRSAVSWNHEKTVLPSPALPCRFSGIFLRSSSPRAVPSLRRRKMLWSLPVRPQDEGTIFKLTDASRKAYRTRDMPFFYPSSLSPPHPRARWRHAPRPCGRSWRTSRSHHFGQARE